MNTTFMRPDGLPSGRRPRRLVAVVAAVALGSAVTLVSGPAQGAEPSAHYATVATTSFTADAACTLTSVGGTTTDEKTIATKGTRKISLSRASSATATNDLDPTDTATYAARARVSGKVVAKAGAFKSLALKGVLSASHSTKKGFDSDCDPGASSSQSIEMELKVTKAGWLRLAVSSPRSVYSQVMVSGMAGGGVQVTSLGSKSKHVIKRKVVPGIYQLVVMQQLGDFSPVAGLPFSASATATVGLVYSKKKP